MTKKLRTYSKEWNADDFLGSFENIKNKIGFNKDTSHFIDDIRKYGFYSGTNLAKIAAFLTGHSITQITDAIRANENDVNLSLIKAAINRRDFEKIS